MDRVATEKCGGTFRGGYATVGVDALRIHALHKGSVSKMLQNRASGLGRSIAMSILNEEDLGKHDIILRSHTHNFVYAGFEKHLGVTLPCFKVFDPFGDTNI